MTVGPLVCAAAPATLDVLRQDPFAERAATEGAHALRRLTAQEFPRERGVGVRGLIVGLDLRTKPQPVLETLLGKGVLALSAATTVLGLLPRLNIPRTILDPGLEHVHEAAPRTPLAAAEADA